MLKDVVNAKNGTGRRAQLKTHSVAGKTASVQVVSLKKNRNREKNVSKKWQEHSMFAAFSPVEKAQIVVLVLSEHDPIGGGGKVAAPIAKKIIKKYWEIKNKREKKFYSHKKSQINTIK